MTCRLCNHDCNQGRDCPYRVQRRINPLPAIGVALIVIAVLLLIWSLT